MTGVEQKHDLKRGAWHYQKRRRPGWSALLDSEGRRRFFRAWISQPIGYALDITAHFALKLLPIDVCSNLGAFLGRVVMRQKYKGAVQNMRRNLEILLPDKSVDEREMLITRNCENLGRLMTEFSVLKRICQSDGRISVLGLEPLLRAAQHGPVVLVTLHLGNWEILSSISRKVGVPFHSFYLPLDNPVEAWVTSRVRRQLGANLLPAGMAGVGPALRILKEGGVVAIFCDEAFSGVIRGPLFGRPAHLKGNLALAVRLARRNNAKLAVVHTTRVGTARFECRFGDPISLPERPGMSDSESVLGDVRYLNSFVEPIMMENLHQWYYLHERL